MSKDRLTPQLLINFIRENSVLSRRDIMTQLMAGGITVNGTVTTHAQTPISSKDRVAVDHTVIYPTPRLYLKFNKPTNVISTFDDPSARRDLRFYLKKHKLPQTLRPCGRLDRDSSGLLLFSNDGYFINHILHPNHAVHKTYAIQLNKPLSPSHQSQLQLGLFLPDGPISIDFQSSQSRTQFLVTISVGRNRILRRAFDYFGYDIVTLHRQSIGTISLGNLPFGQFETIPESQIKNLALN